jgi:uncharacterized membrane protein
MKTLICIQALLAVSLIQSSLAFAFSTQTTRNLPTTSTPTQQLHRNKGFKTPYFDGAVAAMKHSTGSPSISRSPSTLSLTAHPAHHMMASISGGASSLLLRSSLHSDKFYVLSAVMLLSSFGLTLERRTKVGKALSAPLATMGLALIIANLGLIPFSSPIYDFVNANLIPLAIPLLLFDSNLRRVISDTGTLLIAFVVGAFSTVIATLLTYPLVPLKSLGADGWKVACALAARHIGGAINFVAVSETLNVSGSAISAAIAADNVVVALYFALLFSLATEGEGDEGNGTETETNDDDVLSNLNKDSTVIVRDPENVSNSGGEITMPSLAMSLTVASCIVTIGKLLTKALFPSTSALPMISAVTVLSATLFSTSFQKLAFTGTAVGVIFMQMFFAASGAAGSIKLVIQQAPSLFVFSFMQVGIHFVSLMGIGRGILRLKANELYLASNANVGGPTTAAAMAQAKEWKRLVLPALLVGILGYTTATPIALALGHVLLKLPTFG